MIINIMDLKINKETTVNDIFSQIRDYYISLSDNENYRQSVIDSLDFMLGSYIDDVAAMPFLNGEMIGEIFGAFETELLPMFHIEPTMNVRFFGGIRVEPITDDDSQLLWSKELDGELIVRISVLSRKEVE